MRATRSDQILSAVLYGAAAAGVVALLVGERRRPLRSRVEPQATRDLRNGVMALTTALTVRLLEKPLVAPLAFAVERKKLGLVQQLSLPPLAKTALEVALLDYTLYLWHVLTHRVPWLWRLHEVHHSDRDLSASTALRFHFIEMALSAPYRAAQVVVLGVSRRSLQLWQAMTLGSILFHHSNLRLPPTLEQVLGWFVVTPRMHGIHHSVVRAERDSNWASGISVWDRLHGTLRLDVAQDGITIGVPGRQDAGDVTLPRMLAMPFRRGADPRRHALS